VLAGLLGGRGEDWLSKIERGERQIRNLALLVELARALHVSLGDLIGQPVLAEDDQHQDDVPPVRDALMAPRRLSRVLFPGANVEPPDVENAARLTGFAWTTTSVAASGPSSPLCRG
jgi:hypothetical protein